MTTLAVTRTTRLPNGKMQTAEVVLPVARVTDREFATFFAEQAREFLHRQGIKSAHIPDELLCRQIANTFANHSARQGRIFGASPVESE